MLALEVFHGEPRTATCQGTNSTALTKKRIGSHNLFLILDRMFHESTIN